MRYQDQTLHGIIPCRQIVKRVMVNGRVRSQLPDTRSGCLVRERLNFTVIESALTHV